MPPNFAARKSGWLLREHYKSVMRQTREKLRARQNDPKFDPHRSPNYNFKRAMYKSADLPKIAKLLEGEVADGRISLSHAQGLISSLLSGNTVAYTKVLNKRGIDKVTSNPRKPVEESIGAETKLIALPARDRVTGNIVELTREQNGDIKLLVKKPKNQPF